MMNLIEPTIVKVAMNYRGPVRIHVLFASIIHPIFEYCLNYCALIVLLIKKYIPAWRVEFHTLYRNT